MSALDALTPELIRALRAAGLVVVPIGVVPPMLIDQMIGIDQRAKSEPRVRVAHVLQATAHRFRLRTETLIGDTKTSELVLRRHLAMYIAHVVFGHPLEHIGSAMRRDHSTVAHGRDRIIAMLDQHATREFVAGLIDQIADAARDLAALGATRALAASLAAPIAAVVS